MPPPAANMRRTLSQVLRLSLPLGALVLMSTIFMVSRSVDPSRAVALSDLDLEEITREPRIGGARFAAVGQSGTALTIAASALRSVNDPQARDPLHLLLDTPEGRLEFTGGGDARFRAQSGMIDQAENLVLLSGGVNLTSSTGYMVTMQELRSDLGGNTLSGTGGIEGSGPAGQLVANALSLHANPAGTGGYLLAFTGDVRLIYQPQQ